MTTRRKFLETAATGITALSLLPAINSFANEDNQYKRQNAAKFKLRFAVASDIHYGQPKLIINCTQAT